MLSETESGRTCLRMVSGSRLTRKRLLEVEAEIQKRNKIKIVIWFTSTIAWVMEMGKGADKKQLTRAPDVTREPGVPTITTSMVMVILAGHDLLPSS